MFLPLWLLWFVIPIIITGVMLKYMFRPLEPSASGIGSAIEAMFRPMWLIPILFVWLLSLLMFICVRGC